MADRKWGLVLCFTGIFFILAFPLLLSLIGLNVSGKIWEGVGSVFFGAGILCLWLDK